MAKELRRTCRKCGTAWFLTAKEAKEKGPNGMALAGAKMQAIGSGGFAGGYLGGLELQKARVEARNRCPQCGSTDFVQGGTTLGNRAKPVNKIALIKDYRNETGASLVEAKQVVEGRLASGYYDAPAEVAAVAPVTSDTRSCPYCAEEIKSAAIKCKHCGSEVEPLR